MFAARDYIMNVDARDLSAVRDKLLQVPNMNTTGRLPAVLLLHINMQVRITVSDERLAGKAPVDTTAVVRNIELHPIDRARWLQQTSEAIFVLHQAPTVLVRIDEDETESGLEPGVVAVETVTSQPFTIELELQEQRCLRARSLKVRRRISTVMKWISTYMALSRVQSLKQLRSIGLTTTIKDLINNGPPEGFLTRFLDVFEDKIKQTASDVEDAMAELGWGADV